MIADIDWVAFSSVIAAGAVLTALLVYLLAIVGHPAGRRQDATSDHRGAARRESARDAAPRQRHRPAA